MSKLEAPRKFDHGKPQINLIPTVALVEMGKVLAFGAQKYDRGNWAKGLATSRYFDAAQRHLLAWNAGEDTDPESGLSHLAHALVNLAFMIWNMTFRTDLDDRWHVAVPPVTTSAPAAPDYSKWAYFNVDTGERVSPVFVNTDLCRAYSNHHMTSAQRFETTLEHCNTAGERAPNVLMSAYDPGPAA